MYTIRMIRAECGDPRGSLSVFRDHSGSGRNAGGSQRKRHAASLRRNRQPGGRLYDRKDEACRLKRFISMHRRIPVREQSRRSWIWQSLFPVYTGPIKLHVVNFTDIQLYIYEKCPHEELTIIMRRYMMRIAEHFAKERRMSGSDHR